MFWPWPRRTANRARAPQRKRNITLLVPSVHAPVRPDKSAHGVVEMVLEARVPRSKMRACGQKGHQLDMRALVKRKACDQLQNKEASGHVVGYVSNCRLVVSTPLKNIRQIGNLPQIGLKRKNIRNHHLDVTGMILQITQGFGISHPAQELFLRSPPHH